MKVAVFGLGYVGTMTAAALAVRGHLVVGVDVDLTKVEMINAGTSPVVEPGLDEMLAEAVGAGWLSATADAVAALDGADVSLLCVGTPSTPQGGTDLTYVHRAAEVIRHATGTARPPASGHHAVVVRSTVPPGTVESVVAPALRADLLGPGWTVGTAMCPEFLREGSSVADFFDPPMVVVGTDDERTGRALTELFGFLDREVHLVEVRTAEALKYACNAFHATKVSFTNEMSRIFRVLGVDSRRVMELFCLDERLNISPAYLRPGFAYGGSCLPKDVRSLLHSARLNALDLPQLAGTARTNELVVHDLRDRIVAGPGRVVAMLGLSFKMDTDDLRESPSVDLAETLIGKGYELRIYDPIINPDRLLGSNLRYIEARLPHLRRLLTSTPGQALDGCDVAVVATSDPASVTALSSNPPGRVFDLHGRLGEAVEALTGYEGIGWSA